MLRRSYERKTPEEPSLRMHIYGRATIQKYEEDIAELKKDIETLLQSEKYSQAWSE